MKEEIKSKDPLHGVTLERLLKELIEFYGWEELHKRINVNCFASNPTLNSCLKFFRKTPWAREKLEKLYIHFKS